METLLLILLIALTAAVFVVLRRSLDDDRPAPESRAPAGERLAPVMLAGPEPEAAAVQISPVAGMEAQAIPEQAPPATVPAAAVAAAWPSVTVRPTEPVVPAQPVAAVPPVESVPPAAILPLAVTETAGPEPAAVEPADDAPFPWRPVARALMIGGVALVLLSQVTARALPPEASRSGTYLLTLLGLLLGLIGLRGQMRGEMGGPLARLLTRVGRFFGVAPAQVALLGMAVPFAWLARLAAGDGMLALHPGAASIAWLISIAFAIAGAALPAGAAPPARPRLDRWDALAVAVLFVAAFALRGWATTTYPNTFSGDEGAAGLFARQMLDGQATNLFNVGWFSFPSLYFSVQAVAIGLLGQTVEAIRLTSAFAGALTVVAVYLLARIMFNRTTALLAAGYLAASHFHIHMSRIALQNVWDGLFGTLALLGLWAGWKRGWRLAFIFCGLAVGLGLYFYVSTRVVPVLFLVWAAVAFFTQRETFRLRLPGMVLAAYTALIVFLPLGLYFAAHPDEFQAPLNRVTIFGEWITNEMANTGKSEAEIILDQAVTGMMGFTSTPLRLLYNPGSALLLRAAGILFILGVLWGIVNFDLRYLLLFLPLLATIATNATSLEPPSSQRYVLAIPIVAIFIALPLAELARWLGRTRPAYRRVLPLAAAAVMAVVMLIDLNYYFRQVYPSYVLGGANTVVATDIATFLRDRPAEDVYFFGLPRMGYSSLATIPYLAPQMNGVDITEPLTAPPDWSISRPSLFIFLPERANELPYVEQAYPGGRYQEIIGDNTGFLYSVYEVE